MAATDSNASAGEGCRRIKNDILLDILSMCADTLLDYADHRVMAMEKVRNCTESLILPLSPESKPSEDSQSLVIAINDLTPEESREMMQLLLKFQKRRFSAATLEKNLKFNNLDG